MTFENDAALAAHVQALCDASLPKARWTHAGHVAATAGLMLLRPKMDVERELPGLIRHLNESHGVPNSDTRGYHATITLFSSSPRSARRWHRTMRCSRRMRGSMRCLRGRSAPESG